MIWGVRGAATAKTGAVAGVLSARTAAAGYPCRCAGPGVPASGGLGGVFQSTQVGAPFVSQAVCCKVAVEGRPREEDSDEAG